MEDNLGYKNWDTCNTHEKLERLRVVLQGLRLQSQQTAKAREFIGKAMTPTSDLTTEKMPYKQLDLLM